MKYALLILLLFLFITSKGQNTVVSGTITDAKTNQPLQFVSVSFPGTSIGTNSNNSGKYSIETGKTYTQLKFSLEYLPLLLLLVPIDVPGNDSGKYSIETGKTYTQLKNIC